MFLDTASNSLHFVLCGIVKDIYMGVSSLWDCFLHNSVIYNII